MPPRLLALDLDGTLLNLRGEVDPRDRDAVQRALGAGVTVTIATGRIATGSLHVARELGLRAPLVCADGALLIDPVTGEVLEHQSLSQEAVEGITRTLTDHGLTTFWFTHDEIHGEEHGRHHARYVEVWSRRLSFHTKLEGSAAWGRRGEVALTIGVGTERVVHAAHERLMERHAESVQTYRFPVRGTDAWTLLARRPGVDKGTGLARLVERLGITREELVVVGDWENDVAMFRYAGRSFVMGQAPEHIASTATDRLTASVHTGGGVAEAIGVILGATGQVR